jgi:Ni,Fe-hydrogenase maturation factor
MQPEVVVFAIGNRSRGDDAIGKIVRQTSGNSASSPDKLRSPRW